MTEVKVFMDMLEVDGPTSHLSLLLFLKFDVMLEKIRLGRDEEASAPMFRAFAITFQEEMYATVWPYCASNLMIVAAYMTGINLKEKIDEVTRIGGLDRRHTQWRSSWVQFGTTVASVAYQYANEIRHMLIVEPEPTDDSAIVSSSSSQGTSASTDHSAIVSSSPSRASFLGMFFDKYQPPAKKVKCDILKDEWARYEQAKRPQPDPLSFWRQSVHFPALSKLARIVLAVPASSAVVERLFSLAGQMLTKFRKCSRPEIIANSVYLRYSEKLSNNYISDL
jgi:hypothetical protein